MNKDVEVCYSDIKCGLSDTVKPKTKSKIISYCCDTELTAEFFHLLCFWNNSFNFMAFHYHASQTHRQASR